jgi:nucleoside-diphosphate-sugar epimerase
VIRHRVSPAELDDLLSVPRRETIEALRACPGDVLVLGAGGKMGPTLAVMLARAAAELGDGRRVVAASRFSSGAAEQLLKDAGVVTLRCDLLDGQAVGRLPDAPNIVFMAGQKFGTSDAPANTWAMNTIVPAICADRFRASRIVAFSTGNVYPLTNANASGSRERDPVGPVGEYASSALGRERVFEFYSSRHGTRVAIVRLNYAIALRYGVLSDIALKVARDEPVSVDMGYVNVIWQGDANRIAIECLPHAAAPPYVVNVTGPERLAVRDLAERFGERLGKRPRFQGTERPDALLSNTERMRADFAAPSVGLEQMIDWTAEWITAGGSLLGKPTHFEERTGRF